MILRTKALLAERSVLCERGGAIFSSPSLERKTEVVGAVPTLNVGERGVVGSRDRKELPL